jgi:hypothetical protein
MASLDGTSVEMVANLDVTIVVQYKSKKRYNCYEISKVFGKPTIYQAVVTLPWTAQVQLLVLQTVLDHHFRSGSRSNLNLCEIGGLGGE